MRCVATIIILIIMISWPAYADEKTFCNDPAAWEHFNAMVAKYPEDVPLQILYALKIGLCAKITQGSISTEAAITLYNDMIDTLANKRGEDDGQKEKEF